MVVEAIPTLMEIQSSVRNYCSAEPSREDTLHLSYDEFLDWVDEDTRAEWVDGEVVVHSPPKTYHALLADFLTQLMGLYSQITESGLVISAPFEVRLWEGGPSRQPDLLFLQTAHIHRLTAERVEGAPDLVVEIISDDSVCRDRVEKYDEYETAGVQEYWIIDARPGHQRAWFYHRTEQGIFNVMLPDGEGWVYSRALPNFRLKLAWLWQTQLPAPLQVLKEIIGSERARAALG